jgi:hypothetical protein
MDKKPVNNSRGASHPQKKAAFGYKLMFYFRLKIMGVCGYLNSRYLNRLNQPLT